MQVSLFFSTLFALSFAAPVANPQGNFGPGNDFGYGRGGNGWSNIGSYAEQQLDRGFALNAARGEAVFAATHTGNCEWCQKKN